MFHDDRGLSHIRAGPLVHLALTYSSNVAYDRLVSIVGFDDINGSFFTERHGLSHSVLLRTYAFHGVSSDGSPISLLRYSPRITVSRGRHARNLPERMGHGTFTCPRNGNCTTLADLSEAMRRVMLHGELPRWQRFALGPAELAVLRQAMAEDAAPGAHRLTDAVRAGFGDVPLSLEHKPGYATRWVSDVIFVKREDTGERFIVAAAAYGGRDRLDAPLRQIGSLLAARRLAGPPGSAPPGPPPPLAPAIPSSTSDDALALPPPSPDVSSPTPEPLVAPATTSAVPWGTRWPSSPHGWDRTSPWGRPMLRPAPALLWTVGPEPRHGQRLPPPDMRIPRPRRSTVSSGAPLVAS